VFNLAVRALLGLNLRDTQCGFKLFHRQKTHRAFERLTTFGFGFDPELLFLANEPGFEFERCQYAGVITRKEAGFNPIRHGSRMFCRPGPDPMAGLHRTIFVTLKNEAERGPDIRKPD